VRVLRLAANGYGLTMRTRSHVRSYAEPEPFVTLERPETRERAARVSVPAQSQSLAEATIPVGAATATHLHHTSQELYLVTDGTGRLIVDGEELVIDRGDCALIPPGAVHKVFNIGEEPLRIVCTCSPAYSDEDTQLLE
jgi:mannose-6-phosphate isomerase-like protein (cupin superfamily)